MILKYRDIIIKSKLYTGGKFLQIYKMNVLINKPFLLIGRKDSKKQETSDVCIRKVNQQRVFQHDIAYDAYKMYREEQLPTKYYVTKHSKSLVIQSMINIKTDLQQCSTNSLTKNLEILLLSKEQGFFLRINNYPMNYTI